MQTWWHLDFFYKEPTIFSTGQKGNAMDSDVSKILAMVNGHDRHDSAVATIAEQDQEKINDAIESIFMGKSILLWLQGGKLVDAWTRALDEVRSELFAIPNKCCAVAYLRTAVFNHHSQWQHKMTASNERNSIAQIKDKAEYDKLVDHANTLIAVGEQTISDMIRKYSDTGTAHTTAPKTNISQMAMANAHEYEQSKSRVRKM